MTLIRDGARLAGGFLAGLVLALLAGLFLLAWLDVAGGGRLCQHGREGDNAPAMAAPATSSAARMSVTIWPAL